MRGNNDNAMVFGIEFTVGFTMMYRINMWGVGADEVYLHTINSLTIFSLSPLECLMIIYFLEVEQARRKSPVPKRQMPRKSSVTKVRCDNGFTLTPIIYKC